MSLRIRHRHNSQLAPSASAGIKPCGHTLHVGICPDCQRAQLARWRSQLESVHPINGRSVG